MGAFAPKKKNEPNIHTAYKILETFITSTCFGTTLPSSGSFDTKFKKKYMK
jgi:hypothetical protein